VIAWKEGHNGARITLQNLDECKRHSGTRAAVHGLRDDARIIYVPQFLAVIRLVRTRYDEDLPVQGKERFQAPPCLSEKTPFLEDGTKLLWPGVASNPDR